MRVIVENNGESRKGTFLGLISTEHEILAVIRPDQPQGLFLETWHPSKVRMLDGSFADDLTVR